MRDRRMRSHHACSSSSHGSRCWRPGVTPDLYLKVVLISSGPSKGTVMNFRKESAGWPLALRPDSCPRGSKLGLQPPGYSFCTLGIGIKAMPQTSSSFFGLIERYDRLPIGRGRFGL